MTDDDLDDSAAEIVAADVQLPVLLSGPNYANYGRFVFAALGSVPWVGGVIAASAAAHAEKEQGARMNLFSLGSKNTSRRSGNPLNAEQVIRVNEVDRTLCGIPHSSLELVAVHPAKRGVWTYPDKCLVRS
jgi:hypothetical protein